MNKILVVDEQNREVGSAEMSEVQEQEMIHRIVRVLVFNSRGDVYIQQRSYAVSSSPGLWDQSVGGHVDIGETNRQAAEREAHEELGLGGLELKEIGVYYTDTDRTVTGKRLKRFNILYTATTDDKITIDHDEVIAGKWVTLNELQSDVQQNKENYCDGLVDTLSFYFSNTSR